MDGKDIKTITVRGEGEDSQLEFGKSFPFTTDGRGKYEMGHEKVK